MQIKLHKLKNNCLQRCCSQVLKRAVRPLIFRMHAGRFIYLQPFHLLTLTYTFANSRPVSHITI